MWSVETNEKKRFRATSTFLLVIKRIMIDQIEFGVDIVWYFYNKQIEWQVKFLWRFYVTYV